ncbi:methylated-DNA--protein-cysteine methyltransferase [Nanobdella aerobiophila]|uniref:Methylated-DNA--protein-cysteine methyltransferase n=1 Tax=Nanobdella aerobiophila TaxID=2586965 RepID=A0A915WSI2_9ARCH|nr:MGMT family protein [Nanobdella aerobiophila]BBL45325.1 methylated-DNA--protein-cysteine methyltransferase [Nanobdella aerobiophila]
MISILGYDLYAGYIIRDKKILGYSLNYNQDSLIKTLKNIARYHNLDGDIIFDENLDRFFQNKINEYFNGKKILFDLEIYKNNIVYTRLLDLNRMITYKDLSTQLNIDIHSLIYSLKNNPFIILIPCHLVIGKKDIGDYTPLGKKFKLELLKKLNLI